MELNEEKELFICANYLLISFFDIVFFFQLVLHRVLQIAIIELLLEIEWKIAKLDVVNELRCKEMRKKINCLYRVNQHCFSRICCQFNEYSGLNKWILMAWQFHMTSNLYSHTYWIKLIELRIKCYNSGMTFILLWLFHELMNSPTNRLLIQYGMLRFFKWNSNVLFQFVLKFV